MPRYAFQQRRTSSHDGRKLAAVLAIVSLGWAAGGVLLLVEHVNQQAESPFRASAAVVLLLAAAAQWRIVRHVWRRPQATQPPRLGSSTLLARWLLTGLVVAYAVALSVGRERGAENVFIALSAVWYTLGLVPLVPQGRLAHAAAAACSHRALRRIGWATFALAVAVVGAELGLRGLDTIRASKLAISLGAPTERLAMASVIAAAPGLEQSRSTRDGDGQTAGLGGFRIAAVGDEGLQSAPSAEHFLARLQRSVPGIIVRRVGRPEAGPGGHAAALPQELVAFRPDLVLVFVSVGDDIAREPQIPGWFDWQGIQVCRLAQRLRSGPPCDDGGLVQRDRPPPSREQYLGGAAPGLAVCRTPLDERMRTRWRDVLARLDAMADLCRHGQAQMALVVVPGEFQVNQPLCHELCRRAGYADEQIDLALPQRRLTAFADQQELPLLDLLPPLKRAGPAAYAPNASQWNDVGHDVVAQALGRWLKAQYGFMITASAHASNP